MPAPDKRQHIVDTAYALFKRDGFHATGIDRIIAEAAVAKMTMYRHFPSKEALILEVLGQRARRFEAQLDRLIGADATPGQKLSLVVGWYERWFTRPDFRGCLFAHAQAEFGAGAPAIAAAVLDQKQGFRRRLADILAGGMPRQLADEVATALFMMFEGATLMAELGRAREASRSLRRAATAIAAAKAGE